MTVEPVENLVGASGETISRVVSGSKTGGSIKGIIGRSSAVSQEYLEKAYAYRARTGKQLSKSSTLAESIASTPRAYVSVASIKQAEQITKYANTPITSGTNAIEKQKIVTARNIILKNTESTERASLVNNWKAYDAAINQYKKSTGYSNSKILKILSGEIKEPAVTETTKKTETKTESGKSTGYDTSTLSGTFLSQNETSLRKAGYTDEQIQAILKKQAEFKADIKQAEDLQENKVTNYEKWEQQYQTSISGKTLTWSASAVKIIEKLQTIVDSIVDEEAHPYLGIPEQTTKMVVGIPAGILKSIDYASQTSGKSIVPQVKTLARSTAEFPFVTVDLSGRVLGKNGLKDIEALQGLLDIVVTTVVIGVASKGIKKVSPIKSVKIEVPAKEKAQTYRGIVADTKIAETKAIAGIKDGKLTIGTPEFEIKPGYTPKTPIETAIVKPSIKRYLTPSEAKRWDAGFELIETYKKTKPIQRQRILVSEIKSVPAEATKTVSDWLLTQKGSKIFGSSAQKAQLGKGRIPGDIDIGVTGDPVVAAKSLETQLKKIDSTKYKRTGSLIESIGSDGQYHHMIDIHALSDMEGGYMSYGYTSQPRTVIEGEGQIKLGEQLTRKGVSVLAPAEEGTFGPKPHRMKDLGDFVTIVDELNRVQFEDVRTSVTPGIKQIKKYRAMKAQEAIKVFKDERAISEIELPYTKVIPETSIKSDVTKSIASFDMKKPDKYEMLMDKQVNKAYSATKQMSTKRTYPGMLKPEISYPSIYPNYAKAIPSIAGIVAISNIYEQNKQSSRTDLTYVKSARSKQPLIGARYKYEKSIGDKDRIGKLTGYEKNKQSIVKQNTISEATATISTPTGIRTSKIASGDEGVLRREKKKPKYIPDTDHKKQKIKRRIQRIQNWSRIRLNEIGSLESIYGTTGVKKKRKTGSKIS